MKASENENSYNLEFANLLNQYLIELNCSAKELATASKLSETAISRYRQGSRVPSKEGEQISQLASGISIIAASRQLSSSIYEYNEVLSNFQNAIEKHDLQYNFFIIRYNNIIQMFDINMKELANYTNFDVSFLYRVRQGTRRPTDLNYFVDSFCNYLQHIDQNEIHHVKMCEFLSCHTSDIDSDIKYHNLLKGYLLPNQIADSEINSIDESNSDEIEMTSFLQKMEDFDLDEYIRVIHFNDLKIPTTPLQLPVSKTYTDVKNMRNAELDFFKITALSKSKEPIFMCSDMPMIEMAEDMEFNKKWMFGIAAAIKKGLHINIIHDVERPFEELMLGFEAWIPIYMTGQISPYHLDGYKSQIYHHLNYVSGAAALQGECIHGYHNHGHYILSNSKSDLNYYRNKANDLLSHAKPLMDIYDATKQTEFHSFLQETTTITAPRHYILSAPPIFTISDDLYIDIIKTNMEISHVDFTEAYKNEKLKQLHNIKKMYMEILSQNQVTIEMPNLSEQEFSAHPLSLFDAESFTSQTTLYTYEQYQQHIAETKQFIKSFSDSHKLNNKATLQLSFINDIAFRNIQIQIVKKHFVIISKIKSPLIHFVLRHPKMIAAMENFKIAKADIENEG